MDRASLREVMAVLQIDAQARQFLVYSAGELIKTLPIKGLHGQILPFEDYLALICEEAIAEWRRYQWKLRRRATM